MAGRFLPCWIWLPRRALQWVLLALCVLAPTACKETEFRFDVVPMPIGSGCLIRAGFQGDQASWACVDQIHDDYLAQWRSAVQTELPGIIAAIGKRNNALDPHMQGTWLKDVEFMESLRKRHGALLAQLALLDQNLMTRWGDCVGAEHALMMEDLSMDRAIERAKFVAAPGGQAFLDLRDVLSGLNLPPERRMQFDEIMRNYALGLLPAANALAAASIRRPLDGNDDAITLAKDKLNAHNLRALESMQGTIPQDTLDRFKIEFVNHDSWKPTDWQMAAPLVANRLPNLKSSQRAEVARIVSQWEIDDRELALRIANARLRSKDDPRAKLAQDARGELMKQRNRDLLTAVGDQNKVLLEPLRKQTGQQLRASIASLLPADALEDVYAVLKPLPPEAAPDGWPVRKSAETFALFLPPDFQPWVESRLGTLRKNGDADAAISTSIMADSVELWNRTFQEHTERIKRAEERLKDASSKEMSVSEAQRRLRALVSEVESARIALARVEDETITELAEALGMEADNPRVERLRVERSVLSSNIEWRKIPMGSLLRIDREATIDLPTVFAQAKLSPEANAIVDAAIMDAAVGLIEGSERLRSATIDALRSFVLNMKKMIMEFKFDDSDQMASEERLREILAAAAKSVEPSVRARIEAQDGLLQDICGTLAPADARELTRAYWRFAYPEIFYDRHPVEGPLDHIVSQLPRDESGVRAMNLLKTRQAAQDELLKGIIEARKLWANDEFTFSKRNFDQLRRRAPVLAILLQAREEIDTRALRDLALLAGKDSNAWSTLVDWVASPWHYSSD